MKTISIGVDIGGSHISCMAYDLIKKQLLPGTFAISELNNHGNPEQIISIWGNTIKKTLNAAKIENVAGVGFAMPGPFNYVEGIPLFTGENGKYENIYGINVPEKLREFFNVNNDFKIRFINDASAFAVGEDLVGKAKNYNNSLSITLGTGFGSAFIKNGLPVVEGDDVPLNGCVWHIPFADGIADDYFSTRGFLNRYKKLTGVQLTGVKELAQLADNNKQALSLFDDFGQKLGIFLKPWFEKFGVEILVIGGNISNAFNLFSKSMKDYLQRKGMKVNIEVSELKENASIIGSAALVDDEFYNGVSPLLSLM